MTLLAATTFCILARCLLLVSLLWGVSLAQPGPGAECLCFQELGAAGELYQPMAIRGSGDGSGRLFVGEQRGYVWIFLEDGSRVETPFLDMTDTDIHVSSNTGLYALTFHPDFVANQRLYLHYGARYNGTIYQRISEMTVSGSDPDLVDPATERVLVDVFFGQTEGHVGGAFEFGLDGYLYFGIGDGLCCNDPYDMGQNKSTFHSGVHRIDVDSRTGDLPYGIPPDNPFLDEPDTLPEMYAYGFRQPYTSSVDTGDRDTGAGRGRIFIGDVGEAAFEEVDLLEPGGNYGWSVWEGDICHDPVLCNQTGPVVSPVIQYNRTVGVCILLAGVYRGCMNPDMDGLMIFQDYGSRKFFEGREMPDTTWQFTETPVCQSCPGNLTNTFKNFPVNVGSDDSGEFYFSAVDSSGPTKIGASIYKIVDPNK